MTDEGAAPGMLRPGGRTARVRTAVLRAAEDALIECGFDGVDLAEIARRAEVGKTTVYRRWRTPQVLVADLLVDMAEQSVPRTETGSLDGDLRANARLVVRTLTDERQGVLFKAVIAAATTDQRTAEALHRFYATRIDEWSPCVDQAVERGEAPEGTDASEVVRAVSAPLYYRFLVSGDPLNETVADESAHAAACATRAGAYVRRSAR
ncbi:TetR/AcrR family transcriptional regulator [Actinoallomurus spadix]|uniref:TetR-like C-terminal domain-containing protein n=1 Tax=Actinoallomurus spadix TaxID=79912 RepID=A0ABN0WFC3_9ACTN|nr:TetR/AcrR family transcriptional regulator [Actinoallomurus spadix]MCO5987375.1 TetR/AcrR family transcriptional regulator [Actinoallomurus spadix]